MRRHVILDVAPRNIPPEAWADVYAATLRLVEAYEPRLLGLGFLPIEGVLVPVHTRGLECQVKGQEGWRVATAGGSLGDGDPQGLRMTLRHLHRRNESLGGDILPRVARVGAPPGARSLSSLPSAVAQVIRRCPVAPECVRLFGDTLQGRGITLALLAVGMVVETAFPHHAVVRGAFSRQDAETMRRWAEKILGRPVVLPIGVDAWRLAERLGPTSQGEALVHGVDRLLVVDPMTKAAEILHVFPGPEGDAWWLEQLRTHPDPESPSAQQLLRFHLQARRPVVRLLALVCLDTRGPQVSPEAFVPALALLDTDPNELKEALHQVFGEKAPGLWEAYQQRRASCSGPSVAVASEPALELDARPVPRTRAELSPAQAAEIEALARVAMPRMKLETAPGARKTLAARMTTAPPLTEDAWDWIQREQTVEVLMFLAAALVARDLSPVQVWLRRACLEHRELAVFAAARCFQFQRDTLPRELSSHVKRG